MKSGSMFRINKMSEGRVVHTFNNRALPCVTVLNLFPSSRIITQELSLVVVFGKLLFSIIHF